MYNELIVLVLIRYGLKRRILLLLSEDPYSSGIGAERIINWRYSLNWLQRFDLLRILAEVDLLSPGMRVTRSKRNL